MLSYAVLWQQPGSAPVAGRLEFGSDCVSLDGGRLGEEVRADIPYSDIECVQRDRQSVGPLRAIRFDSRSKGTFFVAAFGGLMLRGEILDTLQRAIATVA